MGEKELSDSVKNNSLKKDNNLPKDLVVYHGGIFNKKDLDGDSIIIDKNCLYVAPEKNGSYLGIGKPSKSGEQISALLEIHYNNPLLFIDYQKDFQQILEGKIGQEALWTGDKPLQLRKIKDTVVRKPRALLRKGKDQHLKYRHIVVEVKDDSIRSPLPEEYELARTNFSKYYNKQAIPDEMGKDEKHFFYNQIEKIIQENGPILEKSSNKPQGKLERTLQVISAFFFLTGVSLLSLNLTGNVISHISKPNSLVGLSLILIGATLGFFAIKSKK